PRRRGRALSSGVRRRTTPEMSFPSVLVNETGLLPNPPSNEAYPRVRPSPGRIDRVSAAPIPLPSTPPPTAPRRTRSARRLHLPRALAVRRRLHPDGAHRAAHPHRVRPPAARCVLGADPDAERRGVRRILPGQLASVHAGAARHGELDGAAEPPGIEQQGADVAQPCPACRSGDTLSVAFFPFVDHAGNRTTTDPGVAIDLSLSLDG